LQTRAEKREEGRGKREREEGEKGRTGEWEKIKSNQIKSN